jgi:hypothetical protein
MRLPCTGQPATLSTPSGTAFSAGLLPCKSWDCPRCRRRKASKVASWLSRFFGTEQLYLYTATYYHNREPLEAWKNVGPSCNHLFTLLRRAFPGMSYARIVEPHRKSNYPHIHFISNVRVPDRQLSTFLRRAGFGFIRDVRRVYSDGIGAYLRKYLVKEWPATGAEKLRKLSRCRVVSGSRAAGPIFPRGSQFKLISFQRSAWAAAESALSRTVHAALHSRGGYTVEECPGWLLFHVHPGEDADPPPTFEGFHLLRSSDFGDHLTARYSMQQRLRL